MGSLFFVYLYRLLSYAVLVSNSLSFQVTKKSSIHLICIFFFTEPLLQENEINLWKHDEFLGFNNLREGSFLRKGRGQYINVSVDRCDNAIFKEYFVKLCHEICIDLYCIYYVCIDVYIYDASRSFSAMYQAVLLVS